MESILKKHFPIILSIFFYSILATNLSFSQKLNTTRLIEIISADSIRRHVEFLGHDSLQGRGTGTHGEQIAAHYIADHLKKYQLTPLGDQRTYFQSIPMHGSYPLRQSELKLVFNDQEIQLELGKDYLLYKSGAQTFIPKPVPLVFVGYGIIAPEFDYNDYQSMDATGKVVVFLSGEPLSTDSLYFGGRNPTIYAYPESKQRIAISRGAIGSIEIPKLEWQDRDWTRLQKDFAFEDVTLAYSVTSILSVVINPEAAAKLFLNAQYDLNEIRNMAELHSMQSFPLATKISFKGSFEERDFFASNVIGMIEGTNQKPHDSYLIISAHYDHLGIGLPVQGDSIYNGVLDNAIGVAAVLELARAFAALPEQPLRSVIFLLLTGEEKGLLGSTYYLDHAIVPLHKTIANVNVDGIAFIDNFLDVVGIGAELSTLGDHLFHVSNQMGLQTSKIPSQFLALESFARSDQIAFAKAGIPAILIAEGLNLKSMSYAQALRNIIDWYDQIYHSPFDDLNQPINYDAARQHCQVLFSFCYSLANSTTLPEWKPGTPYINERLRTIAEKR
jgi:hypothetical protein